jgi:hypothetical protein
MDNYAAQAEKIVPLTAPDWSHCNAHGRKFCVRRLIGRGTWFLRAVDSERGRFGNLTEIRSDVASVLETGVLPRAKQSIH